MTKISDTVFTALNSKTSLPIASLASGDLIPVYDYSAAAWKMCPAPDLSSDAERAAAIAAAMAGTPGTQEASKAVVPDTNVNIGATKVTALHIGASGSEAQVTATSAELNLLDLSAQTESGIAASGVVSPTKRVTQLDSNAAAGAITLAAPDASMLGQIKIIEMTVAGNALTMALTEVVGGTAGSSASFDAAGEMLVLIGGATKWIVLKEYGVTLS